MNPLDRGFLTLILIAMLALIFVGALWTYSVDLEVKELKHKIELIERR